MSRVTEGYLVRHYQGVKGGRDAALLDIAQDHALFHLYRMGLFQRGLVFKGGTALRKFRAGNSGRFSTDLDFAAPDEGIAFAVLEALDGANIDGFGFELENIGDDGRRADLAVTTPFGSPQLGAKVELARHALSLPPEILSPVPLPIHARYEFVLPSLPVVRTEEAISEKLARYRRVPLARDLYDLYWYAKSGPFDEALIRLLWVLKVYRDIIVDGRGEKPIEPDDVLAAWEVDKFRPEDIGYLTKPVRMHEWLTIVRARYGFLAEMTANERRWAEGNARYRDEITEVLSDLDWPRHENALNTVAPA